MRDVSGGRRELRKARTRADIRAAAHRLFDERGFEAVTMTDIAAAADVAAQTVFNHFDSKEALFFDGRVPALDGPAEAIAHRAPGTGPLTALRCRVQHDIAELLTREELPERRGYVQAMADSADLRERGRMLMGDAVELTADALATALAAHRGQDPATVRLFSLLTTELFFNAGRVLALEHRRTGLTDGWTATGQARALATSAATFAVLEDGARQLAARLGLSVD